MRNVLTAAIIALACLPALAKNKHQAPKPDPFNVVIERLPIFCTTDSDCESAAESFGCSELPGAFGFICDRATYLKALSRHSA